MSPQGGQPGPRPWKISAMDHGRGASSGESGSDASLLVGDSGGEGSGPCEYMHDVRPPQRPRAAPHRLAPPSSAPVASALVASGPVASAPVASAPVASAWACSQPMSCPLESSSVPPSILAAFNLQ